MTFKFDSFSRKQINNLYLTESILTDWLQMLYKYWDEKYTPYSDDFGLWPDWLYQYFNEFREVKPLKVLISRGIQNNIY